MSLGCWKCGASLAALLLPLGRRDACPSCGADLHACRMCRHHDPSRAGGCRELAAEPVRDPTHANFCGWFVPAPDAYRGGGAAVANTRRALDALFGSPADERSDDGEGPEDLFRK